MAENKLADMSTEFAIQILKLTENIKGHYSLSNQLERSGTSIEQISVRRNMHTAVPILSLNYKLL